MAIPEPADPLWGAVKAIANPWPPDSEDSATALATAWTQGSQKFAPIGDKLGAANVRMVHDWQDQAGATAFGQVAGIVQAIKRVQADTESVGKVAQAYADQLISVKNAISQSIQQNAAAYAQLGNPQLGPYGPQLQQQFAANLAALLMAMVNGVAKGQQGPAPTGELDASGRPKYGGDKMAMPASGTKLGADGMKPGDPAGPLGSQKLLDNKAGFGKGDQKFLNDIIGINGPQANLIDPMTQGGNLLDKTRTGAFGDLDSGGSGSAQTTALGAFTQEQLSVSPNGLLAQGTADASLARIQAQGELHNGPATLHGQADAEVGARVDGKAQVGPFGADLGVAGFAGAKAKLAGAAEVGGLGVGAHGEAWAGIGGEAKARVGFGNDGHFHLGGSVGAAVGIGGKVGVDVDVDPKKVVDTVQHAATDVGHAAEDVGNAAVDVGHHISDGFNAIGHYLAG